MVILEKIHTKAMLRILTFAALMAAGLPIFSQTLLLHPLHNSIGVQVALPAGYDADKTAHCYIRYKKTGDSDWKAGFDADRILLEGNSQFRGSLFLLEEGAAYEVEVTLVDSIPAVSELTLPVEMISTLSPPVFAPTANVRWVAPNGSGTAYTETQPGNIKTLLSSGGVSCGTTVMIKDGLYTDFNMELSITADCNASAPIQFLAAPGANPIFDGGHAAPLNWIQHAGDPKVFTAALPAGTSYTNLCLLNGKMLYPYPTDFDHSWFGNYNLFDLNLEADGFTRDHTFIRIKTQAGVLPDTSSVVLSKAFRFLKVNGSDKNAYLKFKGITVKNIAKSNVSGGIGYTARAFDLINLHHVTFDSCHFEYNNSNILFTGQCNHILIQNSHFRQGNGLWSHAMVKKSLVENSGAQTSMGRGVETGAIELSQNKNVVVRNNRFEGINSGVVGVGLVEEADIYNNLFIDNFDAIECDANWCNLRVWNNEIISPMAGFSMAPPMIGPRYFYRNTIHHLKGRHNEADDPYFVQCEAVTTYNSQATGIKTNSGGGATTNPSNLYFFNNTFHSEDSLGFGYTLWGSEWKESFWVNNIFYAANNHLGYFQGFLNQNTFQIHSKNDNYYSADLSKPLFVIKEIHGQYTCHDVFNVNQIENRLRTITGSNQIAFVNPFSQNPDFISTTAGGFELSDNSLLVNQGEIIKGFYDFNGSKPDLGAKESNVVVSTTDGFEQKKISIYPNPARDLLYVNGDYDQGVIYTIVNMMGQILLSGNQTSGEPINISSLPKGMYCFRYQNSSLKFVKG